MSGKGEPISTGTDKKLLIMGGGYADIPMIAAARNLGFHVVTSGNRPDELGHRHAHEYRPADFSDKDAMLRLAQELGVDAVCACCNDFSALSAAYVAERMGLPGHDPYEVALAIHHKDRYRRFAVEHGIDSPRCLGFDAPAAAAAALEQFNYPVIVKPVDLTGGKGISRAENPVAARAAVAAAFAISRAQRIVVEEFIEGSRHGISTFVRDGKVAFHFADDEYYYRNPYLVSAASAPGAVAPGVVAQLLATIERIAGLLALRTGIVHVQFIVGRDGRPVIIEICRRPPGDLYVRLVEHATGVNYPEYLVRASAGLDCSALQPAPVRKCVTRHCIMPARRGTVMDVEFDKSVQERVIDSMLWWKRGDVVTDELTHKLGIVFLQFDDPGTMRERTTRMQELIRVQLQ